MTNSAPGGDPAATNVVRISTHGPKDQVEAHILALTAPQHGVVTRHQLLEAGVSRSRIDNLLRSGRLQRIHPGVYRWRGHPADAWSHAAAGMLSATGGIDGRGVDGVIRSALSHRSAAILLNLLPDVSDGGAVHVSGLGLRRTRGVRCHRFDVGEDDVVLLRGLAVTSLARTIVDAGAVVTSLELEQAYAAALRRDPELRRRLDFLLGRRPRTSRTRALRRLLRYLDRTATAPMYLRSRAEEAFIELIQLARLPMPLANTMLLGYEVDFLWPEARLVVEVDGRAYHDTPHAFHRDRQRDLVLAAGGYRVLRFTWRQIRTDKLATVAAVAGAIAEGRIRHAGASA